MHRFSRGRGGKPMRMVAFLIVALALLPAAALAQAATPAPAASPAAGAVSVVASGLTNPRGFTFASDGTIYLASAGKRDLTAAVVKIGADGCPAVLTDGFPTERVVFRGVSGFADVKIVDGTIYALLAGGQIDRGLAVNGLYALDATGKATLVVDLSTYIRDHPVAHKPGDYSNDGQPYALLPLPDGSGFYVTEGNSNQLLRIGLDGSVVRIVDLSQGHPIPTGIAPAPDGGVYVALFTPAPYTEGTAKVIEVQPDGTVADAWTGLSTVTALAIGPDGGLYAAEMATGYGNDLDQIRPGTGQIVRQSGPDSAETMVSGLDFPAAMVFGPDGALYIASPTIGADDGQGALIRVDLSAGTPVAASLAGLAATQCP